MHTAKGPHRRDILKSMALLSALSLGEVMGCASQSALPPIEGELLGGQSPRGHRLWQTAFSAATGPITKIQTLIVGGGAAGLSAGWRLKRAGYTDFLLLELEDETGGNSRAGRSELTAYPWGAHYLTAPPPEAKATRILLEELGVLTGYDPQNRPIFKERYSCYAPEERIFYRGEWYPGLYLKAGASQKDVATWRRFEELTHHWRYHRGNDGRRAFTLPLSASSRDPAILALDQISFADYLKGEGFEGERFWWMMNYACRDDYCAQADAVSAWAGLHYHCCRCLHTNPALDKPPPTLTWPEGNHFLAKALEQSIRSHIKTGQLVYTISGEAPHFTVKTENIATGEAQVYAAETVIFAAPRFLFPRIAPTLAPKNTEPLNYGPWLVANLHVSERPKGRGAPTAWDNVLFHGRGVGYVNATHQIPAYRGPAILTYYLPFSSADHAIEANTLLNAKWQHWRDFILKELRPAHPDLKDTLTRLDVQRYGHAMVRPSINRLWGQARQRDLAGYKGLHLAHSDLSLPLFEEAQDHGVRAAEAVLSQLGHTSPSIRGLEDV